MTHETANAVLLFVFSARLLLPTPLHAGGIPFLEGKGQNNIALAALLQLGDPKACVDLLIKTDRIPEAALFARTYAPRQVSFQVVSCPQVLLPPIWHMCFRFIPLLLMNAAHLAQQALRKAHVRPWMVVHSLQTLVLA